MNVTHLHVSQFRNVNDAQLTPCAGMNILYGDNAHGKTNLLESVWLGTGGKSFRVSRDRDLVKFGAESAVIEMKFCGGGREQQIAITVKERRRAALNGMALPAASRLMGRFCAVIFSPDHLALIKDGPEGRRRFIDAACCQLRPLYIRTLTDYTRVLTQRNKLIKAIKSGEQREDPLLLDAFDERLAQSGAGVRRFRSEYIASLTPTASEIYDNLAKGRERLQITYGESDDAAFLMEQLRRSRGSDLRAGFTTVGPHRDDIEVAIGGASARLFGSQGQQRSGVLALKLAEAQLLSAGYGEKPVILLDDVMSELDNSRRDYILNHMDGFQVFITCCEPEAITRLVSGRVFHIENGDVREE